MLQHVTTCYNNSNTFSGNYAPLNTSQGGGEQYPGFYGEGYNGFQTEGGAAAYNEQYFGAATGGGGGAVGPAGGGRGGESYEQGFSDEYSKGYPPNTQVPFTKHVSRNFLLFFNL